MMRRRIQLGMIHVAVAMTLVPINSTLNRVMIKELAVSATLVAILASLPYFFSPIQVAIGSYSDRHPLFGYRRSPYILLGLLLCVAGLVLSPLAAFQISRNLTSGVFLGILAFGAWGMGFNLASVSYLSLASEISGEKGHGRTIAIMWFMLITSIIFTAIGLSEMVNPYTPNALIRAFNTVGLAALAVGLMGLINLEKPSLKHPKVGEGNYSWRVLWSFILENPQALLFFIYLVVLLAALLGQDILLEPFAGELFGLTVQQTTRITSIWGGCVLAALLVAGVLEARFTRRRVANIGGMGALIGFGMITASGIILSKGMFYVGLILLGIGTGLSTVSNLSLMFNMTTPDKVGLYIGAWGKANALSRLLGSVIGGAVRDLVANLSGNVDLSYIAVFGLMTVIMLISLILLQRIDEKAFHRQAEITPSLIERAAMTNDGG